MSRAVAANRPAVLSDLIPGTIVRDVVLVVGAAALTGLAAQVAFPVPGSPVPVTLQTFAVLLSGATLGLYRAAAGMALYLLAGLAGVPWFTAAGDATLGYVVGFFLAASVVGALAGRGGDRTVGRTVVTMVVGTLLIYLVGVPWLAVAADMSLATAIEKGVVPFLIGDGLKVLVAAGLLPAAWKIAS
ncbi:biotin transporter BioY [Herbidospora cretacea]|uniref:biotin transporter BioY n=1 Tax=Herbidospora cretacea TaxID=28444 RepID=UPI0004C3B6EC|nr:biotin transporter BioY [Herbidospora cretacea]